MKFPVIVTIIFIVDLVSETVLSSETATKFSLSSEKTWRFFHGVAAPDKEREDTKNDRNKDQHEKTLKQIRIVDENTKNNTAILGHQNQSLCNFSTYGKRFRRGLGRMSTTRTVTYNIVSYSKKLDPKLVREGIKLAFRKWAEVIPNVFRRTASHQDIHIKFAEGLHGCSFKPSFNGKENVVAHMSRKTAQFRGEIHFNDAADWTVGVPEDHQNSLTRVAMHMIGHILGLRDSTVPGAIMYKSYSITNQFPPELHQDDIDMAHNDVGWCETSFDSIESWMGNGKTYTFKGEYYWRFNDGNGRTEPDYPKPTKFWGGVPPEGIDEMLLWGHNWATYFFKGKLYYRYDDYRDHVLTYWSISQGWPGVPDNIDAAFTHNDLKTYFFKDHLVYQYDNIADHVSKGYPKNISEVFPGVPNNIDTAFRWYHDGKSYFFKGKDFYIWDDFMGKATGPWMIKLRWQNHCFV